MADIEKPDLTNKWAQEGAVIKPTDAKIRLGWTSEVPPHQWQNWWQQRVDSSLSYSLQKGIPEWNEEAEYIANKSFVQFGGDIYKCIQTNTGENPSSKPAYWKPLRDVYSEELELGSASKVDMGTSGGQIRTNSQNDSRYLESSKNLGDVSSKSGARNNLGLGTAATRNVGTSSGNVMEVGSFGLGMPILKATLNDLSNLDMNNLPAHVNTAGFHAHETSTAAANAPTPYAHAYIFLKELRESQYQIAMRRGSNNYYMRTDTNPWDELHHTGNILKTTGNNNEFPMSQKAVTDELNKKSNSAALGTAATRNVGTSEGNVMEVGAFGLGASHNHLDEFSADTPNGFYRLHSGSTNPPSGVSLPAGGMVSGADGAPTNIGLFVSQNGDFNVLVDYIGQVNRYSVYHTGNTTVDGNGFIKEASPLIHLYDNKIEMEGFEQETPAFEKVDVGVYRITGTSGLAQEGWYIDTPQDRNGNKYFNVDWEQDTTPELSSDGLLDEPANVTLIIRTFERVWNPATGVFDNGNPIDINELQSRYIALRFNEVRRESIDDETERPDNQTGDDNVD